MPQAHPVKSAGPTLFVLWLFLLSPVIVNGFRLGWPGIADGLFVFNVGTSLLWLAVLHFGIRRQAALHLLLLPLYVATGFDLFLQSAFHARLTSGYLGLAITDRAETPEFVSAFAPTLALPLGLALAAFVLAAYRLPRSEHRPRVGLALLALVCLLVAYGALLARNLNAGNTLERSALDVAGKELSAPMGPVFQGLLAYKIHVDGSERLSARREHRFGATTVDAEKSPQIVVWIVGESSRPQNWGLFGYERDTTPLLSRQSGLIPLPQMQTTAPHTSIAVPSMLSLRPITDWQGILGTRSIVSAFAEAGFKTHWVSAQEVDTWGGIVPQIAAEAGRKRFYERSFDGVLLDDLKGVLERAAVNERHFIVLHTKGSHFEFARRYPPAFAKFLPASTGRRDGLVAAYDNSVLYTDWLVAGVIRAVESWGGTALVVYASDHGENLLDDQRQLFGHAIGNEFDLPTAALLWASPTLAQLRPAEIARAQLSAAKPLDLGYLPHSVLDLAGVRVPELDFRKSIFAAIFEPPVKRPFMVRGELRGQ